MGTTMRMAEMTELQNLKTLSETEFFSERLKNLVSEKIKNHDESWKKIPGLNLSLLDKDTINKNCFYTLSVAIILQGDKVVEVGSMKYSYGEGTMVVTSVEIPTSFRIIGATQEKPFISLSLKLNPHLLSELMEKMQDNFPKTKDEPNAFCVAKSSSEILSAFERLLRLTENPQHFEMLLPSIIREIHYFALADGQCRNLRERCMYGMPNNKIAKAVEWIKEHYKEPLKISKLAEMACMATSTFHAHFKAVTSLTPLQYQKRLRLHEAKRLMLFQSFSASSAAFEVGYESVQQFSREYKRFFGNTPTKDIGS